MGGFMASRARNAQMLCSQEDTQKCLDYPWPGTVWNGAEGLGSRPRRSPWPPKCRTYHQPPAGPKDARQFSLSVVCLLDEKCWGETLTGTVTIRGAPLCLPLRQQGPPKKDVTATAPQRSHLTGEGPGLPEAGRRAETRPGRGRMQVTGFCV